MSYQHAKTGLVLLALPVVFFGLNLGTDLRACTIAVVSGKATEDGRPLLWKNRDTDSRRNLVQVFRGGKYRLMAVIDAGQPEAVWMGMNEAGFCVANAVSRDLPGGNKVGRGNGRFMKLALETCASVADFEKLLWETNSIGRRTRANFGTIDAQGGAVLFETGHRSFVKFDANDPETAPQGFVVRSNFSMTAGGASHLSHPEEFLKIYSGRRYLRAKGQVENYLAQHGCVDFRFFLQHLSRDLAEMVDAPLHEFRPESKETDHSLPARIDTGSTINRRTTVSAVVFHGVQTGKPPQWTTMWTLLGQPAFSVAVPCWLTGDHSSQILGGKSRSPLCAVASNVRALNYDGPTLLSTRWLNRIWAETMPAENRIIQQTAGRLNAWRKNGRFPPAKEVAGFEEAMAQSAMQSLLNVQTIICRQPALAEKIPTAIGK